MGRQIEVSGSVGSRAAVLWAETSDYMEIVTKQGRECHKGNFREAPVRGTNDYVVDVGLEMMNTNLHVSKLTQASHDVYNTTTYALLYEAPEHFPYILMAYSFNWRSRHSDHVSPAREKQHQL